MERVHLRIAVALCCATFMLPCPAWAGPSGESVVHGSASVDRADNHTQITAGDRTIIEWQNFDIGQSEVVEFVQPSQWSTVLNRVMDDDVTRIDGSLLANGRVYIANPHGIWFGGNAIVDVGQLVAAGGSLSNQDFIQGFDHFTGLQGSVENHGQIRGDAVALLGKRIANHGRIVAEQGALLLLAGDEIWIAERGSPILVSLDLAATEAAAAQPAVENTGQLAAPNGAVRLAAGDPLGLAIRQAGAIRAPEIELDGGEGRVDVAGVLDASDPTPGGVGGRVHVLGDRIQLSGADIDASGAAGGGEIRIGGDAHGGGDLPTARATVLDADSSLRADALDAGDGGSVVVWADVAAGVYGHISARGGAESGDGGFVETSGKRSLDVRRAPDVSAPYGRGGDWLLDPANVTIVASTAGYDPMEIMDPDDPDPDTGWTNPMGDDSVVGADSIKAVLRDGGNVTITTETDVFGGDPPQGIQDGDIRVEAPIVFDDMDDIAEGTTAVLTLRAHDDICVDVDADIANAASGFTLGIQLFANNDGIPGAGQLLGPTGSSSAQLLENARLGNLTIDSQIQSGGGNIVLQGVEIQIAAPVISDGGLIFIGAGSPGSAASPSMGGDVSTTAPIESGGGEIQVFAVRGPSASMPNENSGGDLSLAGPVRSAGGTVFLGAGAAIQIDDEITTAGGDLLVSGSSGRVGAVALGLQDPGGDPGTLSFNVFDDLTLDGSILIADEIQLGAGGDGSGTLELTGTTRATTLVADRIALQAGGSADEPVEGDSASVQITDALFAGSDGASPDSFSLSQDDGIVGSTVPGAGAFVGGVGGLDYTLESFRAGIEIDVGSKVTGSNLVLIAEEGFSFGEALSPARISLETAGDLAVTAELVAQIAPQGSDSAIALHAGSDGTGDLTFADTGLELAADEISLRAGDGTFGEPVARVDAVTNAPHFHALDPAQPERAPESFAIRQDASIDDASIPQPDQLAVDSDLTDVRYTLRADGGSVEIATAEKVAGTHLAVVFQPEGTTGGLSIATPIQVASADLGSNSTFTFTQSLLDQIDYTNDASSELTLRAGLTGGGTLGFEQLGDAQNPQGMVVSAEHIRLVAGDGEGGTTLSAIDVRNSLPTFTGAVNASPQTFIFDQDRTVDESVLPLACQFGDGTGPTQLFAARSNDGQIELPSLDPVPQAQNAVLSAGTIAFAREDGLDLVFGTSPQLELRGDVILLSASEDEKGNGDPIVDASGIGALAGFDGGAGVDFDPLTDLDSSPGTFQIVQDPTIRGANLPSEDAFLGGLATPDGSVDYRLISLEGDIILDAPGKLELATLTLSVGDEGAISFPQPVRLTSLFGSADGNLVIGAGTMVEALEMITLAAGRDGSGDLTFESVPGQPAILLANSISLEAGDGQTTPQPEGAVEEGSFDAIVDARTGDPIFRLRPDNDPELESFFRIAQDGDVTNDTLPAATQFPDVGGTSTLGNVDVYRIISDDGNVILSDPRALADAASRDILSQSLARVGNTIVEDGAVIYDAPYALDGSPDGALANTQMRASEIVLSSELSVAADLDSLVFFGQSSGSPASFELRQGADVTSNHLPSVSQFASGIDGMDYAVTSSQSVTVDGDFADRTLGSALALQSGAGQTTAIGVDLDLFSLSVNADSSISGTSIDLFSSQIQTLGDQLYGDAIRLRGDAGGQATNLVSFIGHSIVFDGPVDATDGADGDLLGDQALLLRTSGQSQFRGNVGGSLAPRSITVEFTSPESGLDTGLPTLEFGSAASPGTAAVSAQGDILLNAGGRSFVPDVATLFGRGNVTLTSESGDIFMGVGEKLSAVGDLTITASGTATLGDLSASGILTVDAAAIDLIARAPGSVLRSDGALIPDNGASYVASAIDFRFGSLRVVGNGASPSFGLPDPAAAPSFMNGFTVGAFSTDLLPPTTADLVLNGIVLDLSPTGASRADLTSAIPVSIPEPIAPAPPEWLVPDPAALVRIGVEVRSPTREEYAERLSGAVIYNDMGGLLRGGEVVVTDPRLEARFADQAELLRDEIFGRQGENAARLRAVLQAALDDYVRATGAARIIGFELRRFILNRPSTQFEAFELLGKLDALFRAHRRSGLTPAEFSNIQREWLREVAPSGISLNELAETVHPSRYVRGSDILDVFGD